MFYTVTRYTQGKTVNGTAVYAILLVWPDNNILKLGAPQASISTKVSMLGYPDEFKWKPGSKSGIEIQIPDIPINKLPSKWAWVIKFTGLKNE